MEVRSNNRRLNEPKHHRRKVVFVDPDDPDAPHWWPALVVPRKEIEIFKQKMDNDVQYPSDGESLVCYFEDGSYSIVPEKDQKPFDPKIEPYITYMEGPNSEAFQRDKAVTLATLYFEKGVVPPVFKWIRNEDTSGASVSTGAPGANGNNLSDGPNTGDEDSTTITKRHVRKESANNVLDQANVNKDGPGNAKRENNNGSQRKDSISVPSKKIQTSISSITTTNNNKFSINTSSNLTISTNNSALITSTDKPHQSSTVERMVPSSRAKQCFQCGEKTTNRTNTINNSDQQQSSSKLLCGDCGDLLNSFLFPSKNINCQNFCVDKNTITSNRINQHTTTIFTEKEYNIQKCIKSGNKDNEALQMAIFENEYYWNHYLEKKRKSPARLWGNINNPEGKVEVLDGLIPLNKRARWLNRSNGM
ncbi:16578_t:CDS:2 [Cetraspora pellucida]|uniref:16578_t:CDS:1 n=1 Tax=Cetraspora pellucida TaxID=1433469 RepID=A0A9N9CFU4_9GLOM|nr:16578_t:CDS:2 [Cetraspora pellucida]